jgi:hypothetical protein
MDEFQLKGLCYNCDEKYFLGRKSKEQIFFMSISNDIYEEDVDVLHFKDLPQVNDHTTPSGPPKVEALISLNALTGLSCPQTLNLIGYIKHQKFMILVDSGSTHNFIHHRIAQAAMCYIRVINNFQIMIANGGSMK